MKEQVEISKGDRDPYEIVQMPDKGTLEDFLRGMSGPPKVIYNKDLGIFERIEKDKKEWERLMKYESLNIADDQFPSVYMTVAPTRALSEWSTV